MTAKPTPSLKGHSMTSKHTPEPWHSNFYEGRTRTTTVSAEAKPSAVATAYTPEDALRIVACVNACAGIDDPVATLAEVREVLEMIAGQGFTNTISEATMAEARAAIAKLGKG